jgi:hypothetical protein
MSTPPRPSIVFPVKLNVTLTVRNRVSGVRAWTITVTNVGTATANAAVIQEFRLTETYGAACTPAVMIPPEFPIQLGDIAPGASASAEVRIDFHSCSAFARFTADAPVSAMDGAATGLAVRNNKLF